jgi:hypothetical protein
MRQRIIGFVSFCAASLWAYFWEFFRSLLYERGSHLLTPWLNSVAADQILRWVPAIGFAGIGAFLFWKTRSRTPSQQLPTAQIPPPLPETTASQDWSLRELFAYLAPHLPLTASQKDGHTTIGTIDRRWEAIGDQVLKQLSLGRLHAIGVGYRNITTRLQAAPIPPEFWRTAKFTYWFLDDDGKGILDAKNADESSIQILR